MKMTEKISYIGVNDEDIDLFESQYVVKNGISYNSYLLDNRVLMDTVDKRKSQEWLENLEKALNGKPLEYLVILHMEPDHAGSVIEILNRYKNITVVGNAKTFNMLLNFNEDIPNFNKKTVIDGETVDFKGFTLQFFTAPMVHWPEVMVAYCKEEKALFSADAFGTFGKFSDRDDWVNEARRYYINIVGKYGAQVQGLFKKINGLDIVSILPLHGRILTNNLAFYMDKYLTWSSYSAENDGVLVAYASIHGNTKVAAEYVIKKLEEKKVNYTAFDLTRDDMTDAVASAFRFDKSILLAASYDGGVFPPMEQFLMKLKSKNYQNRKVAIVENGSWGPTAARTIKGYLEGMKDIKLCENIVTILSSFKEKDKISIDSLIDNILV